MRTHRARECCSTACECESCSAKNNRRSWRSETLGGQQLVSRRAFRTAGVTKVVLAKSSDKLKGVRLVLRTAACTKVVLAESSDRLKGVRLVLRTLLVLKLY